MKINQSSRKHNARKKTTKTQTLRNAHGHVHYTTISNSDFIGDWGNFFGAESRRADQSGVGDIFRTPRLRKSDAVVAALL